MSKNQISITRALVELKTLDSKINKLITNTSFILCKTKKNNYNTQENEFNKQVSSTYQSINDLVKQREKIKALIIHSNATTRIKICNESIMVAEAIEKKKTIEYTKLLLNTLKQQRNTTTREAETHRERVQIKIDENVRQIFSKDNGTKVDPHAIETISKGMWENDPVTVFDPLKIDKEIEDLDNYVTDFEANIDFVLSESNCTTMIEV
ncbi:MAG: hypothetical protein Terrestrivirus6_36 [Terrestrivirus sp.]|uniref:Uncharacterized protein n=1 Tax=Terrestrivirus sp. TaxID=2487775 RepID=A0A3G4ZND9_9VIRU|nr:MAG: hypothetical protein Terrestrivirus6_36 [Terrestrivirus sp.]